MPRKLTKGLHTLKLSRRGPLPHLVALRLDTAEAFPESWQPPRFKVRDLDAIPAKYRKAFSAPSGVDVAALRKPAKAAPGPKRAGSLHIPAWTFDRGNVRIYASPDQYADAGPLIGNDPQETGAGFVEFDIDFPVTAEYTMAVSYAAAEPRPVEVLVDGRSMGTCCHDVTFGSAPFEIPVKFTWNSSGALKKSERFRKDGKFIKMSIAKGKHTLKFARSGPLPNLTAFSLFSSEALPKGWKQAPRRIPHLDSVPAREQSVLLPPGSVNIAALRLFIEDAIRTLGPRYPGGPRYLERLAEFEKKQRSVFFTGAGRWFSTTRTWACEEGKPEEERTIESELAALRREAMLAHPALKFDKLLFVKRRREAHNTYADTGGDMGVEGGKLCILSPVTPNGKITNLVPELDGGRFSRFDLSFDAKKVVFGYKKKGKAYRIYEIDIDPVAGKMVPGSLRQLTRAADDETKFIRRCDIGKRCPLGLFDDMSPCYLPDGRITFASNRSMRGVFCAGSMVTTLYVMDADGKNIRCLSASPLNE